jgi:hypothetical protein
MCVLLGFGADAICPYLIMEATRRLRCEGVLNNDKLNDKMDCDTYVLRDPGNYHWRRGEESILTVSESSR